MIKAFKLLLSLFFLLSTHFVFSQELLNKTEKYDIEIFQDLDSLIINDKVSLNEYLTYAKPFSKWDTRPIKEEKIWALDSIRTSSEISNFFWGAFSSQYKVEEKEAMDKPNQFLKLAKIDQNANIKFLENNVSTFRKLSSLVLKNKNLIYLNQNSVQRIDDLYKEKNKFWSYKTSKNSPFPISSQTIEVKSKFSNEQEKILKLMQEMKIYSLVRTNDGVFFLLDGFTDNSYGFYFSLNKEMEKKNHLFEIMLFENINDEFYYYIAN